MPKLYYNFGVYVDVEHSDEDRLSEYDIERVLRRYLQTELRTSQFTTITKVSAVLKLKTTDQQLAEERS